MRFRYDPTSEQRDRLQAQLARLQRPAEALEVLRSAMPADLKPTDAICTVQKVRSDRFVVRVQARVNGVGERGYALKVYSDDFGGQVWAHSRALAGHYPPNHDGLCLASHYLPQERILIFPWVEGMCLSKLDDERKPELLRRAARLTATLHRLTIVAEQITTAEMLVAELRLRHERLHDCWPETSQIIEPLLATLEEALTLLDPADPTPVHGDLAAGQFLWTGERLILLDLDMFGYTDPAYDAGHFLGQLERRCLCHPALLAHADQWVACFRNAYLAEMPQVSPCNVAFYRGLTLVWKIYNVCRRQPAEWPKVIPQFALRARAALDEVVCSPLAK